MSFPKRLFIGIELPDHAKATLTALDPGLPGLRWLPPAQFHLTLSFLGDVEGDAEELLRERLLEVVVPPFYLPLIGLGSFNAGGRPSVVWVGIGKGHPHLFALHKRVQDAVLRAGLEADLKPFHPHITVARSRGISKEALRPLIKKHADVQHDLMLVSDFALYSSRLSPAGAEHTIELRVPLQEHR